MIRAKGHKDTEDPMAPLLGAGRLGAYVHVDSSLLVALSFPPGLLHETFVSLQFQGKGLVAP